MNTEDDYTENMESWKSTVYKSSEKLINLAINATNNYPNIQRVVIVKRPPRYDSQIKAQLSKYGNKVLDKGGFPKQNSYW